MNKLSLCLLTLVSLSFGTVCDMGPVPESTFKPADKIGTGIYRQEVCVGYEPGSKKPGKVLLQTYVITTDGKKLIDTHFDTQITNVDCYCHIKKEQPVQDKNKKLECVKC